MKKQLARPFNQINSSSKKMMMHRAQRRTRINCITPAGTHCLQKMINSMLETKLPSQANLKNVKILE